MASPKDQRIHDELTKVGFVGLRTARMEARGLSKLIHHDEHIEGAIRGRLNGEGAMFVATNKRMLLLNHKPLFSKNEEISYLVLAGVEYNPQGPFAGVTIYTRMGDFAFRFVNRENAKRFVDFLEKQHLELQSGNVASIGLAPASTHAASKARTITKQAHIFLASHNLGVLSSINADGGVNGAAVYYVIAPDNILYIVTKANTDKAENIRTNNDVAFTVYDEAVRATAQIRGKAAVVTNKSKMDETLNKIIKPHLYNAELSWPPITQLVAGPYQVLKIELTDVKFSQFN